MISLVEWYYNNKRNLPWRQTNDPYKIWLSEIILQQTRVNQGISYYYRFIEKFPTVQHLANASLDEVLLLWQGLGYYSRARNLHTAAKQIIKEFNGVFPTNYEELKSLKGVGEYTAAAIASIAYNMPVAVIDGNVYRVLSRMFAIKEPIDTAKGKSIFRKLADEVLLKECPRAYNQALMELGALICKPKLPECVICPVQPKCIAYINKKTDCYPAKSTKSKIRKRYFYYLIIIYGDSTIIRKRDKKDIWQELFEFPLYESETILGKNQLIEILSSVERLKNVEFVVEKISENINHILSHQHIAARFVHIRIKKPSLIKSKEEIIININDIKNYPFPRLITRYLEKSVF